MTPHSFDDLHGAQLALAQSRDRQWRTSRRNALQRKLDSARTIEREGRCLLPTAGASLGVAVVLGTAGYAVFQNELEVVGMALGLFALTGGVAGLVLMPIGCVLCLVGGSRKRALLRQAHLDAIEVDLSDSES